MVLHILMADDRRSLSGVDELAGKERTLHAGIVSGRAQLHVAAGEIRLESGIDDELNWFVAELLHGRDDLVRRLPRLPEFTTIGPWSPT